jgi:hypothetical protein
MVTLLQQHELPGWLEYPVGYLRLVDQGVTNLTPWHLIDKPEVIERMLGLRKRFPRRDLFPFALRQDNDLVACWENNQPEKVVVIKDFASEGWENTKTHNSFWEWFRAACDDMISFS